MSENIMDINKKKLPYQFGDITPANIKQLRTINCATLPVRYSDKFYNDLTVIYDQEYLKFAFWNGFAVGAVCARVETHDTEPEAKRLYIMTLNVLPAYRRQGIGKILPKD
jgi:N-alpha-acetyltransferase 50